MARDAIQSQLEATEVRIHTMDQRITERLDRMTQTLETVGTRLEAITNSIDTLSVQVVQLNELKGLARQILQALDRQLEATNVQNQAINGHLQVAQQQSANITELAKLVATQAGTVDFLIRRTSA
jgi:chromosome segregation ATPase